MSTLGSTTAIAGQGAPGKHRSEAAELRCTISRLQATIGRLVRDELTARRKATNYKHQADYWRELYNARPRKR